MYQIILVPLDMSRRAERVLPYVEDLAHRYDAIVIFLYVLESHNGIVGPNGSQVVLSEEVVKKRKKEAEIYLASWQGEFREKGITARTRLEYGPVVATIINVAEREKADLIAMASHGRGGVSRVFYGSVAAGVLQRVDRPLLLIRSRQA
ncbi:MAG: universal stress protein [Desulfobacteraceae bacterium]|nr:universal stress protein [Desulfobacteraceae bacterium]